jgi:hypothetical protein
MLEWPIAHLTIVRCSRTPALAARSRRGRADDAARGVEALEQSHHWIEAPLRTTHVVNRGPLTT